VCKSDMFDLRVDFCHLDPKSRANDLEHFRTLIVTGFGLGVAKTWRGAASWKSKCAKVACLTLELTLPFGPQIKSQSFGAF